MGQTPQLKFSVAGGTVIVGQRNWLLWLPKDDLVVRVQVRYREGLAFPGSVMVEHLAADGAVTGSSLRAVPMGRLDQALRDPALQRALSAPSPDLPDVAPEALSPSNALHLVQAVEGGVAWQEPLDLKLDIPARGAEKDAFLVAVAEAYAMARKRSARPAAEIAEANEVATSTVHGWLKEAKRRGLVEA